MEAELVFLGQDGDGAPCATDQGSLGDVVEPGTRLGAPADDDVASRPEEFERHRRRLGCSHPPAPVQRVDRAMVGEVAGGDRTNPTDLLQNGPDYSGREAVFTILMPPPGGLRSVAMTTVSRERLGREDTALLCEMLEGETREEMSPDVAGLCAFHPCHDHEVGVGADDIEGVELDASQAFQNCPRASCSCSPVMIESEMGDQQTPRFGSRES